LLGTTAWSCGAGNRLGASANDAGADARADVSHNDAAIEGCLRASDASEPDVPAFTVGDGGVPLDQAVVATAVVVCSYWSRCSPLAAYELAECIDSYSRTGSWSYVECAPLVLPNASGQQCFAIGHISVGSSVAYPGPGLVAAVNAGLVRYDPWQEAACLQALGAKPCGGEVLYFHVPACLAAFSCVADAATKDGGVTQDGGSTCADFGLARQTPLLPSCTTDSDCPAEAGIQFAGPHCRGGYCLASPCDFGSQGQDGGCEAPVGAGQPCDSDAPRFGAGSLATPLGTQPTRMCRSGLTCRGLSADGGLGACAEAQDIGGPCSENAVISGCALGLVCQCGECRMPPAQGPCVDEVCRVGVAYCDPQSDTCQRVHGIGGNCIGPWMCLPGLMCDSTSNTCQRVMP
jgi:hypothetical protein